MTSQRPYVVEDRESRLAETACSCPPAVPEKLVRCLWFDQRWRPPALHTLTGQPIRVHHPGRWNVQAGPDFQQAVIEFVGGDRVRGDVEIHCRASGWMAHRHHLDDRYNHVVLHVFLWNDRQATEVKRADGQPVAQIALASCLPRPLAAYQIDIPLDDYPYKYAPTPGRCYQTLRQLEPVKVQEFIDCAGDTRLQQRVTRWRHRAREVGLAQVMYEAIMRSVGSTGFQQQFQRLAQHVAWKELQACLHGVADSDRHLAAEALGFGLAGILEQARATVGAQDPETQDYVDALYRFWNAFTPGIRQRAWRHAVWRQPHVRPANAPGRRLAAMAQLLARHRTTDLFDAALAFCRACSGKTDTLAARRLCQALTGMFDFRSGSYWSQRTRLGGRKGRTQRLIGAQRALTVVIDAVLPVLLLKAQDDRETLLQTRLAAAYGAAPRLPDNSRFRYMRQRLLGNDPALLCLVKGARQQQGLLQIYYDHCDNDEGDCQGCGFPRL